jgi:hypothetical protein
MARWFIDEQAAAPPPGDHEGPPNPTSSALAPTRTWVEEENQALQ